MSEILRLLRIGQMKLRMEKSKECCMQSRSIFQLVDYGVLSYSISIPPELAVVDRAEGLQAIPCERVSHGTNPRMAG